MINFSYNLSLILKSHLNKIELLRQKILLTPLFPTTELRFRWSATINRIYWAMIYSEAKAISKTKVAKIISREEEKMQKVDQEILKYKNCLDYIRQNWLASKKLVAVKDVLALHSLAVNGRFRSSERDLKQLLDYLQKAKEHSVIQAAITYIQIIKMSPFTLGNTIMAYLLAYLFLYKAGYDFRGLIVLEECWHPDLVIYRGGNLTPLLEAFAKSLEANLEKTANFEQDIEDVSGFAPSFWELSDRQKAILTYLDQPNLTITNKKVQKLFKVSQITASRDLTKLANLGLLFVHGKGRSVFYTKV